MRSFEPPSNIKRFAYGNEKTAVFLNVQNGLYLSKLLKFVDAEDVYVDAICEQILFPLE